MLHRALVLFPLLAAPALAGCGGVRHVVIETNRPAKVLDSGGRPVCETTPCTYPISRETCWLFDSSSGWVILEAVAEDGTSARSPAMKTCDIAEGEHVMIELPPAK